MTPRIIVVSGSSSGVVLPVGRDPVFVGQETSNTLCLAEPAVSRRHCSIGRHDGGYELVDLGSHNGTFVNGIPVRRKLLSDGDTIRIGDSQLLFALEEQQLADHCDMDSSIRPSMHALTTISVDQEALDNEFGNAIGRMARDLAALLKISSATTSIRELAQLQREILRLMMEVIPADEGATVLLTPSDDQVTSICSWRCFALRSWPCRGHSVSFTSPPPGRSLRSSTIICIS